ncbi:protein IQ-DOMAIN 3 isoform X2 [Prosopis cineraria]|uniref:protein IQ-DOMAIN 3 isoform X2 n=1 Tax=Prosopis cineraria TaxID=364024 RepID=UPI00241073F3|nr:protein IQ-DOMAIN 3 isoform X2 [Prosopis cineraria]
MHLFVVFVTFSCSCQFQFLVSDYDMGRKGNWFSSVRKVLSPHSKKDQDKKQKSNEVGNDKHSDLEAALPNEGAQFAVLPALRPMEDIKSAEAENEQSKFAYSLALATAAAAEAAVAAAQAAAEVVRLTSMSRYRGKSKEDMAAIKIQTAFRGYLARRALRGLKGLVRLKRLVQGKSVKRQAASTLRCMQTLTRLQSQVHERRARMSEENQALQRQLQQKHEKELEKLQAAIVEEWDDTAQSKEQIEAKQSKRQEAAVRRERALAYAFSHQRKWRNSLKPANPTTFMDPNNPHWGWSWLDRWVVAQPADGRSTMDHSERESAKSMASQPMSVGEITKLYASRTHIHHDNKPAPAGQKSSRPPSHRSSSTPLSKAPSILSTSGRVRAPSPKTSSWGRHDDSRSAISAQSQRYRRHTISGSSFGDDESFASSSAFSTCTVPTKSAKAKSRIESPSLVADKKGTPEKGSNAKKRLSFSGSLASSRNHSGPLKVDLFASNKDAASVTKTKVANGGR